MTTPLTVTFRNMSHSVALESAAHQRLQKLEPLARITSCTVTIDAPHRHRHTHRPFAAHVRVKVPGGPEIVASNDGPEAGHEDPYAALTAAFDAVRRQLENFSRARVDRARRPASGPSGRPGET